VAFAGYGTHDARAVKIAECVAKNNRDIECCCERHFESNLRGRRRPSMNVGVVASCRTASFLMLQYSTSGNSNLEG